MRAVHQNRAPSDEALFSSCTGRTGALPIVTCRQWWSGAGNAGHRVTIAQPWIFDRAILIRWTSPLTQRHPHAALLADFNVADDLGAVVDEAVCGREKLSPVTATHWANIAWRTGGTRGGQDV